MKTCDERIKNILEHFNFKHVRTYMRWAKWGWGFDNHLPSLEEMEEAAQELLELALTSNLVKHEEISSGGFSATRYENGILRLDFVIAEYEEDNA